MDEKDKIDIKKVSAIGVFLIALLLVCGYFFFAKESPKQILKRLQKQQNVSQVELEKWAFHKDQRIQKAVVVYTITPSTLLQKIANKSPLLLLKRIKNHQLPTDKDILLDIASKAPTRDMALAVLEHPNGDRQVQKKMAQSSIESIRKLLAFKTKYPEILIILAQDKEFLVRELVAKNAHTLVETLIVLAKDRYPMVKIAVAENKNCSEKLTKTLTQDSDIAVQNAAYKKLKKIEAQYEANGLVKYQGKWIKQQEFKRLQKEKNIQNGNGQQENVKSNLKKPKKDLVFYKGAWVPRKLMQEAQQVSMQVFKYNILSQQKTKQELQAMGLVEYRGKWYPPSLITKYRKINDEVIKYQIKAAKQQGGKNSLLAKQMEEYQKNLRKRFQPQSSAKKQQTPEEQQQAKGLVKYQGKWITPQKKFAYEQEAKGLVKYQDKWISQELFAKKQKAKGLIQYQGKWFSKKEYLHQRLAVIVANYRKKYITPGLLKKVARALKFSYDKLKLAWYRAMQQKYQEQYQMRYQKMKPNFQFCTKAQKENLLSQMTNTCLKYLKNEFNISNRQYRVIQKTLANKYFSYKEKKWYLKNIYFKLNKYDHIIEILLQLFLQQKSLASQGKELVDTENLIEKNCHHMTTGEPQWHITNATGYLIKIEFRFTGMATGVLAMLAPKEKKTLNVKKRTYHLKVSIPENPKITPFVWSFYFKQGCRYSSRIILTSNQSWGHQALYRCPTCHFNSDKPGTCPFCKTIKRVTAKTINKYRCKKCSQYTFINGKCIPCKSKKKKYRCRKCGRTSYFPGRCYSCSPRKSRRSSRSYSRTTRTVYKCSRCGYSQSTPGSCPVCR